MAVSQKCEHDDGNKEVKIDKWDGSALKNALDDSVKSVFVSRLRFTEDHSLVDGRLLICTTAVFIALFALVWDYFFPFPKSRTVLIVCVLSYFMLMGILTLYTTYREKNTFMVALEKDPAGVDPSHVWRAASKLKRFDDTYNLTLSVRKLDGTNKKGKEIAFSKSVANFFDVNGTLHSDVFEGEIMKLIKKIQAP